MVKVVSIEDDQVYYKKYFGLTRLHIKCMSIPCIILLSKVKYLVHVYSWYHLV